MWWKLWIAANKPKLHVPRIESNLNEALHYLVDVRMVFLYIGDLLQNLRTLKKYTSVDSSSRNRQPHPNLLWMNLRLNNNLCIFSTFNSKILRINITEHMEPSFITEQC
jgi:hypothetical protein